MKGNWFGHILCKNCLLKPIIDGKIEGRIEVQGRRGRRNKQVLDELKETGRYWKLNKKALAHSVENSLWKRLWTTDLIE